MQKIFCCECGVHAGEGEDPKLKLLRMWRSEANQKH